MSGAKGLKASKEKPLLTNNQIQLMIDHNTKLMAEVQKARLPLEMTPSEYNRVIEHLNKVKILFNETEAVPQPIDEGKA